MEKRSRELYVQCLPEDPSSENTFYQRLLQIRADVVSELKRRGVKVVEEFSRDSPPSVLVLFQSTGRIGDELPAALPGLDTVVRSQVIAFAAIQDDEVARVGREALPTDFQPDMLLDTVAVPMTARLKDCPRNREMLSQLVHLVASKAPVKRGSSCCESLRYWLRPLACSCCPSR